MSMCGVRACQPIACPACEGTLVEPFPWPADALKGRGEARRCLSCEVVFVDPLPSPAALAAYYAPNGEWQASRKPQAVTEALTRTKPAADALFAALDRYLPASKPQPGARVLDFGCGTGIWLNSFQDRGWHTTGLEPSTDVAFARHERLTELPAEPSFELVVLYHVLEHLPSPLETLKALATVLVPGGHLLVSVPRLDTVKVHGQYGHCLNGKRHLFAFSEVCLRGLLHHAGLTTLVALHDLDAAFTGGRPLRLRLLARKA